MKRVLIVLTISLLEITNVLKGNSLNCLHDDCYKIFSLMTHCKMGQCRLVVYLQFQGKEHIWYLNSGCSSHITGFKSLLEDFIKKDDPTVTYGDNGKGATKGYGSIKCNYIVFKNVSYVKVLQHNLISISQMCDTSYEVLFKRRE